MLLPQPRGQLRDTSSRVLPHALQNVDQVGVGIDTVQSASHEQALHNAYVFGAELGPAEESRPSSHWNGTQCALEVVGINRHIGVGEKDFQS